MDAFQSFSNDKPQIDAAINQSIVQRPCHTDSRITPEMMAPLLLQRSKEAIERMRDMVTKLPRANPLEEESSSKPVAEVRHRQSQERLLRCALMEVLEATENSIKGTGHTLEARNVIEIWHLNIMPLIERVLDFSRTMTEARRNSHKIVKQERGNKDASADEPQSEEEDYASEIHQRIKSVREFICERVLNEESSDRSILSSMRYDPFTQPEETHLNELAINLKRQGVEAHLDDHNPIVEMGCDDLGLITNQTVGKLTAWKMDVIKLFSQELLDPSSSLLFLNKEELIEHLALVSDIQNIKFRINGVDELIFSTEIPHASPSTLDGITKSLKTYMEPITTFGESLGCKSSIETITLEKSLRIELKIHLPLTFSRFEPDTFRLNGKLLSQIESLSCDPINQVKSILGQKSVDLESALASEEYGKIFIVMTADAKKIEIDSAWFKELSLDEALKAIELATRLITSLSSVKSARISLPSAQNLPFFGSSKADAKARLILIGDDVQITSPYENTREFLEWQRTTLSSCSGIESIATIMNSIQGVVFKGEITFETLQQLVEHASEMPRYVRCINLSTRIFELKKDEFDALMSHLDLFHQSETGGSVLLQELPDAQSALSLRLNASAERDTRFIVFSKDQVPLGELVLSGKNHCSTVVNFPKADFEALRDRIAQSFDEIARSQLLRSRDIDAALNRNGIDVNSDILDSLTTLCNSAGGKPIPKLRITEILSQYLVSPHFTIRREGEKLSFLHESDRELF